MSEYVRDGVYQLPSRHVVELKMVGRPWQLPTHILAWSLDSHADLLGDLLADLLGGLLTD